MKKKHTPETKKFSPAANVKKAKKYRLAREICAILQENNFAGYLVGGSIRDLMLKPTKIPGDFDIATSASPKQIFELFKNVVFVGEAFGVCLITLDGVSFEITTFRKEGRYLDRRHPESIHQGTMYEDTCRRDFTVNSLYFDLVKNEILDFHGGIKDLKEKRIRCVGNAKDRMHEDVLRILRMCRFAANLNFSIEAESKNAAQHEFSSIKLLSKERIILEFQKIKKGKFFKFVQLLLELGDLKEILANSSNMASHDLKSAGVKLPNDIRKAKQDTKLPFFNFLKTIALLDKIQNKSISDFSTEAKLWPISSQDKTICLYFFKIIFLEERFSKEKHSEFLNFIFYLLLRKIQEKSPEDFKYICDIIFVFIKDSFLLKTLGNIKNCDISYQSVTTQEVISVINKKNLNKKLISITVKYLEYLKLIKEKTLNLEEILEHLEKKDTVLLVKNYC